MGAEGEMSRARLDAIRMIMAQISELRRQVNIARSVKVKLSSSNTSITTQTTKWSNKLTTFESGTMGEVVVIDKFEGVSAETIKGKLPDPIAKMDASKAAAVSVQGEIAVQITKLDRYIEEREARIAALQAQL